MISSTSSEGCRGQWLLRLVCGNSFKTTWDYITSGRCIGIMFFYWHLKPRSKLNPIALPLFDKRDGREHVYLYQFYFLVVFECYNRFFVSFSYQSPHWPSFGRNDCHIDTSHINIVNVFYCIFYINFVGIRVNLETILVEIFCLFHRFFRVERFDNDLIRVYLCSQSSSCVLFCSCPEYLLIGHVCNYLRHKVCEWWDMCRK